MQPEQQLRASLKEINDLKAALDEHAIVAITDPQGRITYVNDKFCAISKYSEGELLGQDHRIINSGFHSKEFIGDLWATIGRGKVWKGEIKNKAKDGSFYWVDTTIVPFLNDDKKPRQYVAIRADITERKRTEDQLKASFKEIGDLKAALDEHAIVAITDPQGRITYVNDKFCAISKYSREELLGQDHRIINSGFHSKEFIGDLWATIGRGKVWKGEIKNKAKDGSFYWVDTTIVPFLSEDGKPRQYVAIRADITERKRMEMVAVHLAAIVKFSGDAIIGKNLDGTITSWNAGAVKIFGYSSDEMLGSSILRLIPADRHDEEHQIIEKITRGESVQNLETVRQSKGGRLINVSITSSPIKDSNGHIIGASKVARDITERKLAEEKIRQLNAELEQRVAERTAELEAFSYSISHDLRAPLRAMGGFARMIQEDFGAQFPTEASRQLERIQANAMKMGLLIDGLLAFSKLSRQPLSKHRISPATIVSRVLEELQGEMEGRKVEIITGNLPSCEADATLLHQVFMNLISNALKYSRQRDLATIEIGSREEGGRCVYFIKDNGAGFETEYAHNLFGVFQRLHRADQFEGTGVGLAIVRRIIHRHGGRVWAEAKVDKGATFYFTLEGENIHA